MSVALWLLKRKANMDFPYAEVADSVAKPIIAAGDGQDLNKTAAWELKRPDYKSVAGGGAPAAATDFSFGAPAAAGAVNVTIGSPVDVPIVAVPGGSTLGAITVQSATPATATAAFAGGKVTITGLVAGDVVVTVTMGSVHHDLTVTVAATAPASAPMAEDFSFGG